MIPYFFDTETRPIWPGRLAPPPVCLQDESGIHVGLVAIRARFERVLRDPVQCFVGHSVVYDMAVLGAAFPDLLGEIFRAFASDRVICTRVREKLLRIAQGADKEGPGAGRRYDLTACCDAHGIDHGYHTDAAGAKAEPWRVRYGELEDIPVERWPADAIRYALLDVRNLRTLFTAQELAGPREWYADQYRQTRADWALHLVTCWGVRTAAEAVRALAEHVEAEHVKTLGLLTREGLVRPNGTKDTARARDRMTQALTRRGIPVPTTDTGAVSLAAATCAVSGDPVLEAYARFGSINTLRSRADRLRHGTETPLQPRYDVLKETGRTSCTQGDAKPGQPVATWGFQIQNVHREPGLRECFVPRSGYLLCSCDWSSAEMHTVAQVCLWMGIRSRLADTLNAGQDPHLVLAASILGWNYDRALRAKKGEAGHVAGTEIKRARQMAKAGNFGFPGGMGAAAFQEFAAQTYGVHLGPAEVALLKDRWFGRYPEFREYFARVNALVEAGQPIEHYRSRRFRGGATYCATCNTFFQGLAADMAKDAAFNLAAGCYLGAGALGGCRVVAFIHDEFLVEVPEATAHEAALAVQLVMEEAGRAWCPDVPVRAEPALMRAWSKGAEPAYIDGRLVAWEDRSA